MEQFRQHCTDIRPNVTYLAIGAAFSHHGGSQQHPPFLEKLMTEHPEFTVQVIIVDPEVENPPDIVKYYPIVSSDKDWFASDNLNVHVVREIFDSKGRPGSVSKQFLYGLINRTITAKQAIPANTYLLFIHDFSGNDIDALADELDNTYSKLGMNMYNNFHQNILVGLDHRQKSGSNPDLNSIYFHPELVKDGSGTLEVVDFFHLNPTELASIFMCNYPNQKTKTLAISSVSYRLKQFADTILTVYRQTRLFLEKKLHSLPLTIEYDIRLFKGISKQQLEIAMPTTNIIRQSYGIHPSITPDSLITKLTSNMLTELKSVLKFLEIYGNFDQLFEKFISASKKIPNDAYQLHNYFKECSTNTEVFLLGIKASELYTKLNEYVIYHIRTYHKLPLCLDILLQQDPQSVEKTAPVDEISLEALRSYELTNPNSIINKLLNQDKIDPTLVFEII